LSTQKREKKGERGEGRRERNILMSRFTFARRQEREERERGKMRREKGRGERKGESGFPSFCWVFGIGTHGPAKGGKGKKKREKDREGGEWTSAGV